ncbi:MAG: Asp23/Gls24 family envelope stress response protein [Oscillospiraceae bacterium]|nr:Asp23/Gls24 family envelope stress response protein [Oscillospiraceae bacterium]
MIVIETHIGTIRVSKTYLYDLIEQTVTSCFGVADLNDSSLIETVKTKMFPADIHRGIRLHADSNQLVIDLHIITGIGANISAIADSIRNKVRYAVEQAIGVHPAEINVYIDGIRA